ncbi:hypothetical protein Q9247_09860 [Halomonas meridiana]|uniref:hypothetical protein n=1 Tax=Vreelandella aquamarina TaxID=77097 RepID=UPI00273C771A|nr:hypothetical protein [Halomonas meridiana]MDP4557988.1 hypothetical protein [Halomonas meridiana]
MAKRNDWELIEREYRTGRFSLAQLEARHGVNRSNISRRARKYGWEKDLTDRVRERTQQKIARASLPPEAQATLDDEVVEQAANENAAVVKGHRKTLERWRGITERFAVLLESQLAEGKIAVELPRAGLLKSTCRWNTSVNAWDMVPKPSTALSSLSARTMVWTPATRTKALSRLKS